MNNTIPYIKIPPEPDDPMPGRVTVEEDRALCRRHGKLLCRVTGDGLELRCKYGHNLLLPWEKLLYLCPKEKYEASRHRS